MALFFSVCIIFLLLWIPFDLTIGTKYIKRREKRFSFPLRYVNVKLFTNGQDLFENYFDDIQQAQHYIYSQFFIIRNDEISNRFLQLLIDKKRQGVTVRLLLDRVGCKSFTKKQEQLLLTHGVELTYSNPIKLIFPLATLNYRNHRKISIIDGKIGYFGGFNVGKEYIGLDPKLGKWRDFHLRVVGKGVEDLQQIFLYDWQRSTKQKNIVAIPNSAHSAGKAAVQFFASSGKELHDKVVTILQKAKKEICIGTPYFIPGPYIKQALLDARTRGVTVTIIVPKLQDHPLVKEASFPYFRQLLASGCSVYQYTDGFYHGKVLIIDDEFCDIGTANFDKRSFYINDEINCFIMDRTFLAAVKEEFVQDILRSERLTRQSDEFRSLWTKGKELIGTLFSYFL